MLKEYFKKPEPLVILDIGSTAVKMLEATPGAAVPEILNIAVAPFGEEVFNSNLISKPELVASKITQLLEENSVGEKRVVISLPAPTVFTKIITMQHLPYKELEASIQFEAGRYVPDSLDAVKIDYHVLGDSGKNNMEVLLVAVKNEILNSFLDCLFLAGLEAAVVDVDYFALQNAFELSYPEEIDNTVALINIGARFSCVNICKEGKTLYSGAISVGGNLYTTAIASGLGISEQDAEKLKRGNAVDVADQSKFKDILAEKTEQVASEFNRQLSLFWNASGIDEGIEKILVTGGGSLIPGLLDELTEKTGISCSYFDVFKGVEVGENFDLQGLEEIAPLMGICVGMATRQPSDKEKPDFL